MVDKKEFEKYTLDSEKLAQELASALNTFYYDFRIVKPDVDALKYVPKEIAEKAKAIPLKKERNTIILCVVDPYNEEFLKLKDSLTKQGLEVKVAIISLESFEIGKESYKFLSQRVSYTQIFEINKDVIEEVKNKIDRKEKLQEVVDSLIDTNPFLILDYILAGALKFNTSDVHLEVYEKNVIVRYRLDGVLYDVVKFPSKIYGLIKNRVKVLSGLMINIVERPQDGRFSISYDEQSTDIRVATIPSSYDESIVLRILNFAQIQVPLENIGLRKDDLEILNYAIHQPHGLILNTGPTGSGKTTTLYAIILRIKKPEVKIITVENPVEYRIEGINQVQIDEAKGFTFASALRSILRHDPDVILVGEIRDKDTANTAVQASLTGHLVMSTLHTNDSLGAIPRLISLEVDPKLIPSSLSLVIAQRLVRKICQFCKEEYEPDNDLKERIKKKLANLPPRVELNQNLNNFTLVIGKGCSKCFNTGYKGRLGIFELLRITKELESLIYEKPSETEILKAVEKDFVNLQQDALIKAIEKVTTIEEVERITGTI